MEQARFKYIMAVGLWSDAHDFNGVGQIVAEATCTYRRPVLLEQIVDVAVRVSGMGNKSAEMDYRLTVGDVEVATGHTVQVAYDYSAEKSISIPTEWRAKIEAFESGAA